MKMSEKGLAFLRQMEGVRYEAYKDSVGIPTIGVGHTGPDVFMGQKIDDAEVNRLLAGDVRKAEQAVSNYVTVPMTQDQFDALVSFTFNVGVGAFWKSTLLKKINAGQPVDGEFMRWTRAGGNVLPGLVKRRALEVKLFNGEWTA